MARSVNGVSEVGSSVSSLEFGENVSPRTFQFTTGPTPEGRLNETVGPLLAFNTSSWGLPVMTAILATPGVNNGGWEQVENEDGIEVFKRKLEGSSLLEFKGTVVLPHNILDVASVVMDVPHSCQWLHECADQHYLHEDLAHQQAWSYFRQSGPIVVADRDVIFKLTVTVDRKTNEVVSAFEDYNNSQNPAVQIPPVPDDVVRMPNIDGEFRLKQLGPRRTLVTYSVHADPGGWIPDFVANWAGTKIPFETLNNLRNEMGKPLDKYSQTREKLKGVVDWTGFDVGSK